MLRKENWFERMYDLVVVNVEADEQRAVAIVNAEHKALVERFGTEPGSGVGHLWLNVFRAHPDWDVVRRGALCITEFYSPSNQSNQGELDVLKKKVDDLSKG
jgi:hypothetical protein